MKPNLVDECLRYLPGSVEVVMNMYVTVELPSTTAPVHMDRVFGSSCMLALMGVTFGRTVTSVKVMMDGLDVAESTRAMMVSGLKSEARKASGCGFDDVLWFCAFILLSI